MSREQWREDDAQALAAEQAKRDGDLRALLGSASGRRFFWRLVDEQCGVLSGSYSGKATHEAAYLEGRRSVARELIAEAQRVSPGGWLLAMQEAMTARQDVEE